MCCACFPLVLVTECVRYRRAASLLPLLLLLLLTLPPGHAVAAWVFHLRVYQQYHHDELE